MIVSALCYRQSPGGLEFLLVRTKGGRHWTLPKGHVKKGEDPLDAAAREAKEEAGVTGAMDPEPVGSYLYPGGSGPKEERKKPVIAYFLEVVTEDPPEEKGRRPTWCTPEDACRKLAEGRTDRYAREHERIIKAALERRGV